MENFVNHHPFYKKRKRIGLAINILIAVSVLIFYIYFDVSYLILFFVIIALVLMVSLGNGRMDNVFAMKTKKVFIKKEIHKQFLGKKVTFSFNNEFITSNDKQYMWNEYSIVDTDDLYVFMYLKDSYKVTLFPKFPKDLPLEERDKLNRIIQEKFNVNIRL